MTVRTANVRLFASDIERLERLRALLAQSPYCIDPPNDSVVVRAALNFALHHLEQCHAKESAPRDPQ